MRRRLPLGLNPIRLSSVKDEKYECQFVLNPFPVEVEKALVTLPKDFVKDHCEEEIKPCLVKPIDPPEYL